MIADLDVRKLDIANDDLAIAYSGAHALIYSSKYAGLGLPVLDAMACGCPVITCRNSSLAEIAGEAALFVEEHDVLGLVSCILKLESEAYRADLRKKGQGRAASFGFAKMASIIEAVFRDTNEKLQQGSLSKPGQGWRELRDLERLKN